MSRVIRRKKNHTRTDIVASGISVSVSHSGAIVCDVERVVFLFVFLVGTNDLWV